jgi:N(2)-fixation sustaining protein CowN
MSNLSKTDRYVSFQGIDCDGKAHLLMQYLDRHIGHLEQANPFWEYFKAKREGRAPGTQIVRPDDLFLIHSHLDQIRRLFEETSDQPAIDLLNQIEEECC